MEPMGVSRDSLQPFDRRMAVAQALEAGLKA